MNYWNLTNLTKKFHSKFRIIQWVIVFKSFQSAVLRDNQRHAAFLFTSKCSHGRTHLRNKYITPRRETCLSCLKFCATSWKQLLIFVIFYTLTNDMHTEIVNDNYLTLSGIVFELIWAFNRARHKTHEWQYFATVPNPRYDVWRGRHRHTSTQKSA